MSNGRGKINLTALTCAIIPSKKDPKKHVLCIPVEDNNLYFSEKGNVYLDIIYNEVKNRKAESKDTHIVNQSVPKEVRDALAAMEPKKYPPTLGNLQHWDGGQGYSEPAPNVVEVADNATTGDLPF
jgi:hypothetical protein